MKTGILLAVSFLSTLSRADALKSIQDLVRSEYPWVKEMEVSPLNQQIKPKALHAGNWNVETKDLKSGKEVTLTAGVDIGKTRVIVARYSQAGKLQQIAFTTASSGRTLSLNDKGEILSSDHKQ